MPQWSHSTAVLAALTWEPSGQGKVGAAVQWMPEACHVWEVMATHLGSPSQGRVRQRPPVYSHSLKCSLWMVVAWLVRLSFFFSGWWRFSCLHCYNPESCQREAISQSNWHIIPSCVWISLHFRLVNIITVELIFHCLFIAEAERYMEKER